MIDFLVNFAGDHPEIGHDPVASLLVNGLSILAVDPALDVRAKALQALVDLGMEEIPNTTIPMGKPIGSELPTVGNKGDDSRTLTSPGMSFLPKSWQAKSWRTFSPSSVKSIPNERMSVLPKDDNTRINKVSFSSSPPLPNLNIHPYANILEWFVFFFSLRP